MRLQWAGNKGRVDCVKIAIFFALKFFFLNTLTVVCCRLCSYHTASSYTRLTVRYRGWGRSLLVSALLVMETGWQQPGSLFGRRDRLPLAEIVNGWVGGRKTSRLPGCQRSLA